MPPFEVQKNLCKRPLKNRQDKDLNDQLSLNAKYCRLLPLDHSVILMMWWFCVCLWFVMHYFVSFLVSLLS